MPFEARDVIKQPLSVAEVKALGKRLGGLRELVAPKRREELSSLTGEALARHLSENPGHLRRPLIDTGDALHAGFTSETRERLSR
jgi:arsenate reductase-like glutaredoxin family protein